MAKRKNRNRSAKKGHTTDCKTFAQQAREYGEYLRWAHRRVSWPVQTREGFDLDPLRLERRINAAVQLYEDFREILHETAPELECRADEVWLKLCLGAIIGMDSIDFSCSILLGAAIWILDCLAKCGRFEEACKLFPSNQSLMTTCHARRSTICDTRTGPFSVSCGLSCIATMTAPAFPSLGPMLWQGR